MDSIRYFCPIREVLQLEKDGGPTAVCHFEEDLRRVWGCHPHLSKEAKVDMIWTHIQPIHRSELLCHPPEQQSDPDEVLEILHHVFGDKRSVRDMFRELCQIQQREGEDLLMYSHRLMNVNRAYDQVCMKKKCNVLSRRELLELFVTGITNTVVKRMLFLEVRRDPNLSFLELRELAFIWEADPAESNQTPAPITAPLHVDPPPAPVPDPCTATVETMVDPLRVPAPDTTPARRTRRRRRRRRSHRQPQPYVPGQTELQHEVKLLYRKVPVCEVRRHSLSPKNPCDDRLTFVPPLMSVCARDYFPISPVPCPAPNVPDPEVPIPKPPEPPVPTVEVDEVQRLLVKGRELFAASQRRKARRLLV